MKMLKHRKLKIFSYRIVEEREGRKDEKTQNNLKNMKDEKDMRLFVLLCLFMKENQKQNIE